MIITSAMVRKLGVETGPLFAFFLANVTGKPLAAAIPAIDAMGGPIFFATGVLIAATIVAFVVSLRCYGTVPLFPLISSLLVVITGSMTLWLGDESFIKMKPTVSNGLFAVLLLGGWYLWRFSFLRYMFDGPFRLTGEGWRVLTLRWGWFFLFSASLNEVLWRTLSTDQWVIFKVWGVMAMTLAFTFAQLPAMRRYKPDDGACEPATEPAIQMAREAA